MLNLGTGSVFSMTAADGARYTFDGNWSDFNAPSADGGGGAIYNIGSLFVQQADFSNNNASNSGLGGAIYNRGHLLLQDVSFSGNKGYSGGAISSLGTGTTLVINNAAFSGNQAYTFNGGAIISTGTLSVSGSTFENNTALNNAGALFAGGTGTATVSNSSFTNNKATVSGGAIYSTATTLMLTNTVFTGNQAVTAGGAVYATGGLAFTNTAFTNNVAGGAGGALYLSGSNAASPIVVTFDTGIGGIAFSGNRSGVSFDGSGNPVGGSGTANGIYAAQNVTLNFSGADGSYIDDPITSGTGGGNSLNKTGTGFLQFSGSSVLNADGAARGGVTVSGGVFRVVTGASFRTGGTSSTFAVNSGATLAGGGTITAQNGFNINGTLSPDSDIFTIPTGIGTTAAQPGRTTIDAAKVLGTLTVNGNVSMNNATLSVDLGSNGSSADKVAVNGTVTLSNTNLSTIDLNSWNVGTYTIMTATSGLGQTGFNSAVTINGHALSGRQTVEQKYAPDGSWLEIKTLLDNEDLVWAGGTGNWNYTQTNWAGAVNQFAPNDYATFNNTSEGKVTVQDGGVQTSGMVIDSGTFTFTGGKITGTMDGVFDPPGTATGRLDITGANVTMGNALDFVNGIDISSSGVLTLADGGSPTDSTGIVVSNNSTLDFAMNADTAYGGVISGTGGTIKKTGTGILTLSGTNTHTGMLSQDAGTINLTGSWAGNYSQSTGSILTSADGVNINGNVFLGGTVNPTGTLVVGGNLYLDGAVLHTVLQGTGSNKIAVTGTVSYGNNSTIDLENWLDGTYTLIMAGSGLNSSKFSDVTLNGAALGTRQTSTLTSPSNSSLVLTVYTEENLNLVWTGATGSVWNSPNLSWKQGALSRDSDFVTNDFVTFDNSGVNQNVDVQSSGVQVAGMEIAGGTYSFSGGDIIGVLPVTDKGATRTGRLDITGGSAEFHNQLSFENGAAVSAGASMILAEGSSFTGNIDNGGNLRFDRTTQYTYGGVISGTGTIEKTGGGLLILDGANTSTGMFTQSAGDVHLSTNWSGDYHNASNNTFSAGDGVKIAGNVRIGSGGIISPGNSLGTTKIQGNMVFDPGSFYDVEVDPTGTGSDLLDVNGSAMLTGATVRHIGFAGNYKNDGTWTILRSGQQITTTFDGVQSNFLFLDASLNYLPNEVQLSLMRNNVMFTNFANTRNQFATATALDSISGGSLYNELMLVTDINDMPLIYDQLSGELHASVSGVLQNDDRAFGRMMRSRSLNSKLDQEEYPFWITMDRALSTTDATQNTGKAKFQSSRISIGAEKQFNEKFVGGVAFRYGDSKLNVDQRFSKVDIDSYSLGLYGNLNLRQTEKNLLRFTFGGSYGYHDIASIRNVIYPALAQRLSADYKVHTFQLFAQLGQEMKLSEKTTIEPYFVTAWNSIRSGGFSERGGDAALSGKSNSNNNFSTTLGIRAEVKPTDKFSFNADLGWQHIFGDKAPESRLSFVGSKEFSVLGAPLSRDTVVFSLGAKWELTARFSLKAGYEGMLGNDFKSHSCFVKAEWLF